MRMKHILAAVGLATATLLPTMASAQYYHGHPGYHRAYGHGDWRARRDWQHRRWEEAHRRHWQHARWNHRGDRHWR